MRRFGIVGSIALVALLFITRADQAQNPPASVHAVRWEYGKLEQKMSLDEDASFASWTCPESSPSFHKGATSIWSLYSDLGGTGKSDPELGILNLLGDQGWEFVSRHDDTDATEHFTLLFKREK